MRRPMIAGNWKMYKTNKEARELIRTFKPKVTGQKKCDILLAPPFTSLTVVKEMLTDTNILLAGQNCHFENEGAFTGDIAPAMLKDAGCSHVILGHSERRHVFGESNEWIGKKVSSALEKGLKVILCVGEKLEERESGRAKEVVYEQLHGGLSGIEKDSMKNVIIAYEPVWAIGTGKTATPDDASDMHKAIREWISKNYDADSAEAIRILYGGSVKPGNVDQLMARENIDGCLVGGASLKADDFARIVKFEDPS